MRIYKFLEKEYTDVNKVAVKVKLSLCLMKHYSMKTQGGV
jgi:hypothetical protein